MTATHAKRIAPPEDVIKDLRDQARTYFTLDLTYIAAIGAGITAFKLERPAIFEYIASGAGIAQALFVLIIFDAMLGSWLTEQWVDAKRGRLGYGHSLVARILAAAQPIVHACFVVFTLTTVVSRTEGFYRELWIERAEADLQEKVEQFRVINKHYPTSIDELEPQKPYLASVLSQLKGEHFEYHKVGDNDYQLTFKRAERGAGDDHVATHEFQLRPIVDAVEKSSPFP
jgi:hypothetical protein